ncbi:MAG TPA: hypothetical protein VN578_09510 [Candidatus Binatia bacterium]|jgi:hypothetical protein|nr:hypothetical protein [Candidatus Binatia bacterium]
MDAATLLFGAGQLALVGVLCSLLYHLRRDTLRSSLAALLTVLIDLREKNTKALQTVFGLIASDAFQRWDEQVRSGLLDSARRLRAIQDATTEALLQTLRQCDSEWRLAGRLHSALRSQLDPGADRQWERWTPQENLPQKGCA